MYKARSDCFRYAQGTVSQMRAHVPNGAPAGAPHEGPRVDAVAVRRLRLHEPTPELHEGPPEAARS